jgi:hypothetical protein
MTNCRFPPLANATAALAFLLDADLGASLDQ